MTSSAAELDTNPDACVVYVTCPADVASGLATALIESEQAACVNIVPGVTSVYRWQGEVTTDLESLLVIKTTRLALEALLAKVVSLHPYDTPEFIALPIDSGYRRYIEWVRASVAQSQ